MERHPDGELDLTEIPAGLTDIPVGLAETLSARRTGASARHPNTNETRQERFRAKWIPVRVKKTHQSIRRESGAESINAGKARHLAPRTRTGFQERTPPASAAGQQERPGRHAIRAGIMEAEALGLSGSPLLAALMSETLPRLVNAYGADNAALIPNRIAHDIRTGAAPNTARQ